MSARLLLLCAAALVITACVGRGNNAHTDREGVDAPVRRSPDGRVVAIGLPPTALLIDLATGSTVTTAPPDWLEAYMDPDTDEVVVWRVGSDDVNALGPAYAMQQDRERVWLQRGPRGPFVTIDKATLAETVVAAEGTSLDVQRNYTTLVIDGVLTVVSPRTIAIDVADAVSSERTVVGERVLFEGDRDKVVDLATGTVTELDPNSTGRAILLANGVVVMANGRDLTAVDGDGSRRTLCENGGFRPDVSSTAVMCQTHSFVFGTPGTATLVDAGNGSVLDGGSVFGAWLSPEGAYAFATDEGTRLVFDVGQEFRSPLVADIVTFNRSRTAAMLFEPGEVTIANQASSTTLEQRQASLFTRYAVVLKPTGDSVVVRLDTLQLTPRATGMLLTVELDAEATRPALRAWLPAADAPIDVLANVDRVLLAEQQTAVVVVDEPGNISGENGTVVVPLP
jgi:hypothetical protein